MRWLLRLLIPLVRALNALGLHRRRQAPLDLEALDRETRAALAKGPVGDARGDRSMGLARRVDSGA